LLGDETNGPDSEMPMEPGPHMALLALGLFATKHFVSDFLLQTGWMHRGNGVYGHPGGLAHAGVLMLGSLPTLVVLGPVVLLALMAGEGLIHYHIDWSKETLTRRFRAVPAQRRFWVLLGADQFLHHLTCLAMTALALGAITRTDPHPAALCGLSSHRT
jgi:hypothetical protein